MIAKLFSIPGARSKRFLKFELTNGFVNVYGLESLTVLTEVFVPRRLETCTSKYFYGYPLSHQMNTNLKQELMKLVKQKKPKIM